MHVGQRGVGKSGRCASDGEGAAEKGAAEGKRHDVVFLAGLGANMPKQYLICNGKILISLWEKWTLQKLCAMQAL